MTAAVWITGAHGFLGRHLCTLAAQNEWRLFGVGHGNWPEPDRRRAGMGHWINGDVDHAALSSLQTVSGPPSYVFHLAGGSSVRASLLEPFEDLRRTVLSTAAVLDWLRVHAPDAVFVMASSAAVYGTTSLSTIPESSLAVPISPYGINKYAAELMVRNYGKNYGVRSAILRMFSVYGPGLEKQLVWDIGSRLNSSPSSLMLSGTGNELRDWIFAEDAARALLHVRDHANRDAPIFNAGTGHGTSVRQIAELIIGLWKSRTALTFDGVVRGGDPLKLVADPTRLLESDFLWKTSLAAGMTQTVNWLKLRLNAQ